MPSDNRSLLEIVNGPSTPKNDLLHIAKEVPNRAIILRLAQRDDLNEDIYTALANREPVVQERLKNNPGVPEHIRIKLSL